MPSIVDTNRLELEKRGEYVVRANSASGWFAVFDSTWRTRLDQAHRDGRPGPNLVVYRTKSTDPRDHYVIPFDVARDVLVDETLTHSTVNGSLRWNLTLKNDQLHVTHRPGHVDVGRYHSARLLVDSDTARTDAAQNSVPSDILEGIARENTVISRSRSRKLRDQALERSQGTCQARGVDFTNLFDGKGLRALHVHHKQQLALRDVPAVTRLDDLAVVCATCHAIIHADPKCALPVELLAAQWIAARRS